jgi:hypothetical protein
MKATITQHAKATLFLVVFATLISVAGASAQTSGFFGTFTLPYEVHWRGAVLPPGAYTIRMSSIHSPGIVRSADGKILAYVFTVASGDSEKGSPSLTIVSRGNERKVASMNLPAVGVSLVYSPMTKSERETLAKAQQIEAVPLVAAKK